MSGYISEFFGFRADDKSDKALMAATGKVCPFTKSSCVKMLARAQFPSGVCSIRQKTAGSPDVICCPVRMYADDYAMLRHIAYKAFDAIRKQVHKDGEIQPLGIVEEHCTTVYKVQEAFSAVTLPEGNVYRDAICQSLFL